MEIKHYDGTALDNLPESVRVLIVRERRECEFQGNVALVQTSAELKIHPDVRALFSEYQDI